MRRLIVVAALLAAGCQAKSAVDSPQTYTLPPAQPSVTPPVSITIDTIYGRAGQSALPGYCLQVPPSGNTCPPH